MIFLKGVQSNAPRRLLLSERSLKTLTYLASSMRASFSYTQDLSLPFSNWLMVHLQAPLPGMMKLRANP